MHFHIRIVIRVFYIAIIAPRGGGGRGTLIFSYISRLGPFFFGSNFGISIFFWVFRKINIFLDMKIL